MVITYVQDGDSPWDSRTDKVCTALVEAGHEAHLACRNLARPPRHDEYRGTQIHLLRYPWLRHLEKVARSTRSDLVIARDVPMASGAVRVAKRLGIPAILDMSECYPEQLRCVRQFEGRSLVDYFGRNPKLAERLEAHVLRDVDHVWVMVEEARDRLLGMGLPTSKVTIVRDTPVAPRFPPRDERKASEPLRLIYVGPVDPSRGLDSAIDAVARYAKEDPGIELIVVGSGSAEEALYEQALRLGVARHVSFLGSVDRKDVPGLLRESDVGVVPHHKCPRWDTTIPSMLFEYMAAGVPVLASSATPVRRIVSETGCGLVHDDYDLDGLTEAIRALAQPAQRGEMARRGIAAVADRYNWSRETQGLLGSLTRRGAG